MRRQLPVRWRLTAWNAGFLVIALIVFGAALFIGLRFFLFSNFDEQVRTQSSLARAAVHVEGSTATLEESAIADLQNRDHFVRLLNVDGSTLSDPGASLADILLDPNLLARARAGESPLAIGKTRHGTMVYATTGVHNESGVIVAILQTGASREDIDELLDILALGLLLAAPIVIAIAVIGGYLLARNALRPVARITDLAAKIGASDLHARLDLDLPDDELGRLAQTFDDMLARIEDAFSRQRRFTGDAAHELRTPLSLMRSQVDLALAKPRSSEEYRIAFREFDQDLSRLTRLVETLLGLARSDQHGMRVERSLFDVAETIDLIAEQYGELAESAQISMHVEITPTPALLDEDLIIQLLVNLLDNALANTPTGGTIVIGCCPEPQSIHLWVRDTGIGITPEHLPYIFERFYRVDPGRARAQGGSGLGLAISKTIVEAQDGTISLSSTPGIGTSLNIRFPQA